MLVFPERSLPFVGRTGGKVELITNLDESPLDASVEPVESTSQSSIPSEKPVQSPEEVLESSSPGLGDVAPCVPGVAGESADLAVGSTSPVSSRKPKRRPSAPPGTSEPDRPPLVPRRG